MIELTNVVFLLVKALWLPGVRMQAFIEWVHRVGITAPKLRCKMSPQGRRGLFAVENIASEEFIATVPRSAMITSAQAASDSVSLLKPLPEFGPMAPQSVHLALALTAARLDADSPFAPWMQVLPASVPTRPCGSIRERVLQATFAKGRAAVSDASSSSGPGSPLHSRRRGGGRAPPKMTSAP